MWTTIEKHSIQKGKDIVTDGTEVWFKSNKPYLVNPYLDNAQLFIS